jgi:hypothetical protein
MFQALGFALSARLILLLTLMGAFVLGVMAMLQPSGMRLGVMVAYCLLSVVPCTYLELNKRRG